MKMIEQIRALLENFARESAEDLSKNSTSSGLVGFRSAASCHHHHHSFSSFKLIVEEAADEAVTAASDYLMQHDFPHSFAHIAARRCVDQDLSVYLDTTLAKNASTTETNIKPESDPIGVDTSAQLPEEDETKFVDAAALIKWARENVRAYCRSLVNSRGKLEEFFSDSTLSKWPYQWNANAARNSRRKMEDRHAVLPNVAWLYPNVKDASQTVAFAVYDGHGGQECADYARTHLFSHIFHSVTYPVDICQALHDGFLAADARMLKICEQEGRQSGTTAVCAIIKDEFIHVAWLGDSRALIVERANVQKITDPLHDTKNQSELARVQADGGLVFNFQGQDRVNGLLNITRSLGDLALKPSPLSAKPEVAKVPLSDTTLCLVLASDGLFDGHDWEQVDQIVRDYLKEHDIDEYPNLAKYLVDAACNKTSDNVTVVVVFLKALDRVKAIIGGS